MKQIIKLTEGDLHQIVKDAVKKILREMDGGGTPSAGVGFNGGNSTGGNGANNAAGLNRETSDVSGGIVKPAGGLVDPNDPTLRRKKGNVTGIQDKVGSR